MIVDSTALPEQAVTDIIASAFQSAGQRCSALRCLYVQDDIAEDFIALLKGAMDQLRLGDPWDSSTDVGPIIDAAAKSNIAEYIDAALDRGKVIHHLGCPNDRFIAPTLIKVDGINDLDREIFGPVLHVATFKNHEVDKIINDINAKGYGLTFGLHTRIDRRVQDISDRIHVGNIYVNRNQIGAIVGSQPFGGEGLSGTGPKAGGPNYLLRFAKVHPRTSDEKWATKANFETVQQRVTQTAGGTVLAKHILSGPTGEENILSVLSKGPILCAGPGRETAIAQARSIEAIGGNAVILNGTLSQAEFIKLDGIYGVMWWRQNAQEIVTALSLRDGPIIPLITGMPDVGHVAHERHLCVDTTASGGNAALLAG